MPVLADSAGVGVGHPCDAGRKNLQLSCKDEGVNLTPIRIDTCFSWVGRAHFWACFGPYGGPIRLEDLETMLGTFARKGKPIAKSGRKVTDLPEMAGLPKYELSNLLISSSGSTELDGSVAKHTQFQLVP